MGVVPAHVQRAVDKIADDTVGMRVFLVADSSTFPSILRVQRSLHCWDRI